MLIRPGGYGSPKLKSASDSIQNSGRDKIIAFNYPSYGRNYAGSICVAFPLHVCHWIGYVYEWYILQVASFRMTSKQFLDRNRCELWTMINSLKKNPCSPQVIAGKECGLKEAMHCLWTTEPTRRALKKKIGLIWNQLVSNAPMCFIFNKRVSEMFYSPLNEIHFLFPVLYQKIMNKEAGSFSPFIISHFQFQWNFKALVCHKVDVRNRSIESIDWNFKLQLKGLFLILLFLFLKSYTHPKDLKMAVPPMLKLGNWIII